MADVYDFYLIRHHPNNQIWCRSMARLSGLHMIEWYQFSIFPTLFSSLKLNQWFQNFIILHPPSTPSPQLKCSGSFFTQLGLILPASSFFQPTFLILLIAQLLEPLSYSISLLKTSEMISCYKRQTWHVSTMIEREKWQQSGHIMRMADKSLP